MNLAMPSVRMWFPRRQNRLVCALQFASIAKISRVLIRRSDFCQSDGLRLHGRRPQGWESVRSIPELA
jgi:hypothetical protein